MLGDSGPSLPAANEQGTPSVPPPEQQALPAVVVAPVVADAAAPAPPKLRSRRRQAAIWLGGLILVWLVVAYFVLPLFWRAYSVRHKLADIPEVTHTRDKIPGDPLNAALVGTEEEVKRAMLAANWQEPDRVSVASSLKIAVTSVFKKPYESAPMSSLYLWGRPQDLAFQQAVGNNPRQRHHVRFWRSEKVDDDGRPIWVGAATYDDGIALARTTLQITHHVAADVDHERGKLFEDLQKSGVLAETYIVPGFHKVLEGKNGGGHPWRTDGDLYAGVIKLAGAHALP
jgi:hypothetical protein